MGQQGALQSVEETYFSLHAFLEPLRGPQAPVLGVFFCWSWHHLFESARCAAECGGDLLFLACLSRAFVETSGSSAWCFSLLVLAQHWGCSCKSSQFAG